MFIDDLRAVPISFPVLPERSVRLGIGRSVKRDAVLVRVTTDERHVGRGEAHHGRAPGAIARLVDTTLRGLLIGRDASDVTGAWSQVYRMQLASHGMGAAASMALSGIEMALWDIRAQSCGWPLYRLLGGANRPIKAYAGGIALGWQDPGQLAEEALRHIGAGYRALKLRVGDAPARDIARVQAVSKAVGAEVEILVDANAAYSLDDVRRVMPAFEEAAVAWLEEPFAPHDRRAYQAASRHGARALGSGREPPHPLRVFDPAGRRRGSIVQPDLPKTGGLTKGLRIAAMAGAHKISVNPHTSATALNMAATIHFRCAVDNPGDFEGDVTTPNPFRDLLFGAAPYALDERGCVRPLEGIGYGVTVDTDFIERHPLIEGPCYV